VRLEIARAHSLLKVVETTAQGRIPQLSRAHPAQLAGPLIQLHALQHPWGVEIGIGRGPKTFEDLLDVVTDHG